MKKTKKKALTILVNIYKKTFSSLLVLVFGKGCRFYPTCSVYSRDALEKFGLMNGTWLSVKRVWRCHPFSKAEYFDPA